MKRSRRALVIGAGVIGATSAEMLLRTGFDVTVLDAEAEPAQGGQPRQCRAALLPLCNGSGQPGVSARSAAQPSGPGIGGRGITLAGDAALGLAGRVSSQLHRGQIQSQLGASAGLGKGIDECACGTFRTIRVGL